MLNEFSKPDYGTFFFISDRKLGPGDRDDSSEEPKAYGLTGQFCLSSHYLLLLACHCSGRLLPPTCCSSPCPTRGTLVCTFLSLPHTHLPCLFAELVKPVQNWCPKGWKIFKNTQSCYSVSGLARSWNEAALVCKLEGAKLVTVETYDENEFVYGLAPGTDLWIGYSRQFSRGEWEWADGTKSEYTNWANNQPDNRREDQECVLIWGWYHNSKWDDRVCTDEKKFVCEKQGMLQLFSCTILLSMAAKCFLVFFFCEGSHLIGKCFPKNHQLSGHGSYFSVAGRPKTTSTTFRPKASSGRIRKGTKLLQSVTVLRVVFILLSVLTPRIADLFVRTV